MANDNILIMNDDFTEEEREQIKDSYVKNMKMANSLTEEQKNFLMDGGWYNEAMRGYIITAARFADFTPDEIERLIDGFCCALDVKSKAEAEQVSRKYGG